MRVAALYDIHGNLPALEAVLRDVEVVAPDLIVVGGDVVSGPMPSETLNRLLVLGERVRFIRGNTDRLVVDHFDGAREVEDDIWVRRDAWAAEGISRAQREVLAAFPETLVVDIDGLGPTLFCHGSPRSDEEAITRVTPPERLEQVLAGTAEDVIVCGHTHVQFDREHAGKRVINAGSVGMHSEARPGAYWLLLGPGVEFRRTEYDLEGAAARIRSTSVPDPEELVERLTADDPSRPERMSALRERQGT